MINSASSLQNYVKTISEQYQKDYSGLLCEVVKYDNMFCEVKIKDANDTAYNLKNVPIISSKYSRPIIQVGDLGVLLNIHRDFYNTLIELENSYSDVNSYVFLPIMYKKDVDDFQLEVGNDFGNIQIETSPDKLNTMKFSNEGLHNILKAHSEQITEDLTITSKNAIVTTQENTNVTATKNITLEATEAFTAKGKNVTMTSESPIAISASGEGAQLGSMLAEILNAICTALNDAGVPLIVNHSAQMNPSLPGDVSNIQSMISRLQKILS